MARLSPKEFRQHVKRVLDSLPPAIARHTTNLAVDVEDEPDEETLMHLGFTPAEIAEGDTLFGLFVPFPQGDLLELEERPNRLIIYQRPHEEACASRRELLIEIRKTVIHELAHHFGWTDADLERFDNSPNPFPKELP
ncbi:MAG TPA: metallopeptidase family protein [Gemmatales bacterium]|nr:metallopeptidase family protein [Gemmatales bacterium]HMP61288.1 metallopeptidase family protein [Gemmatales bacterium]